MHFSALRPLLPVLAGTVGALDTSQKTYFTGTKYINDPTTPLQLRLAYQGHEAMMVSWNTFQKLDQPTVRYGLNASNLDERASSNESFMFPTSETFYNHVNVTGLTPDTTYYYLPQGSNKTEPYHFKTQKPAGDMTPFTAAVVVDMGTFGRYGLSQTDPHYPLEDNEQTTIQDISTRLDEFDFITHPGDLAYADYWLREQIEGYLADTPRWKYPQLYEWMNNAFYEQLANISSYKPYMVSPGNHEANCNNGGFDDDEIGVEYSEEICPLGQTNFTAYRARFRMPAGPSNGFEGFWYSYDHGMAHLVHIDVETDLGNGLEGPSEGKLDGYFGRQNQQINWLKNDLASVDRTKTPWVVVFGHRPLYCSAGGVNSNVTEAFEDIFNSYGVDLYMCGHTHVYERITPIYNNTIDPNGLDNPSAPWYIVNGIAGHYNGKDEFDDGLANYSRYAQGETYSWSKLIFHNCTHLTQQAIASPDGSVYDEATLYKARRCGKEIAEVEQDDEVVPGSGHARKHSKDFRHNHGKWFV